MPILSGAAPPVAELRPVCHPAGLLDRRSGEHWAGRWYMRRLSLQVTRFAVRTPLTPNALTLLMTAAGVLAACALAVPGPGSALAAALLVQVYLLLDCVDGEVARWRRQTSVAGVYLDRVGHYVTEAALLVAAGLHVADGADRFGGWAVLGCLTALGAVLIKAQTDLVDATRARSGLPPVTDAAAVPRSASVARMRRWASASRFHRLIGAVEMSLLLAVASVADGMAGGLAFERAAVVALAAVAGTQAVLHPVSILLSSRLR